MHQIRGRKCFIGGHCADALKAAAMGLVVLVFAGCAAGPSPQSGDATTEATAAATAAKVRPEPAAMTPVQQKQYDEARQRASSGQTEEAIVILAALQAERPDLAAVSARLAWLQQQHGNVEQAIELNKEALDTDPGNEMATNNLALLLQSKGEFKQAREYLDQGLSWHPDSPKLHYNLAILSELYLLDLPSALQHYQRYQTLEPNGSEQVKGWIADLQRRLN
ncbi:tetratricopeptide repeat protein [Marinobacter sp. V034]|uniref:tetratricopeptide repeat protein n=1 Tax=Marinobacter sp. V034 TaxID=3459610 RepID=UPI004043D1E2